MRIEKTYYHEGISSKRIFKGVVISLVLLLTTSVILNHFTSFLPNYYSPESEVNIEEEKKEVMGIKNEDTEVVEGYRGELKEYIEVVQEDIKLVDTIFLLMERDILGTEGYLEALNFIGTRCKFSVYPYEKGNIPYTELIEKVERLEGLSISFCNDLRQSTEISLNMIESDDYDSAARDLERVRDFNSLAYNKSLMIGQVCKEIEVSVENY